MSTNYFLLEQGCLNPYQINLLNKINKKNKKEYISLLDKIYLNTNRNKKWILSPLFSRDFVQSNFFSDLNFLGLVDHLKKNKKIKKVKVKNIYLKKIILQKYPDLNVTINITTAITHIFFKYYEIFSNFIKLLLCTLFMITSKNKKRKNFFKGKKITLIETFFSKNLIQNNKFKERYNKEAYLRFPKALRKRSFFFPINLSILHIKKFLKITKKDKIKFIHPLDFLKTEDYIESIFLIPSLKSIKNEPLFFKKFEISKLVKLYNFFSFFNYSTFLANLNFNFLKRLKENNIKIDLILDWYENQIIDKGISMGKNKFFKDSKIKGHMGFLNDFRNIHYYYPTKLEHKLRCVPEEVLLINKNIYRQFFKNNRYIKYKIVPSSRNQEIFSINKIKTKKKNSKRILLFILSANQQESNFIFKLIENVHHKFDLSKNEIRIKTHPNTKLNYFIKKCKNIEISNKSIYEEILNSEIVIGGGTTATIEAQILNKKIILVGNNSEIMLNPLMIHDKKSVKICYDTKTLLKNIINLSKLKLRKDSLNKNLLNYYFLKFTRNLNKNFYN